MEASVAESGSPWMAQPLSYPTLFLKRAEVGHDGNSVGCLELHLVHSLQPWCVRDHADCRGILGHSPEGKDILLEETSLVSAMEYISYKCDHQTAIFIISKNVFENTRMPVNAC